MILLILFQVICAITSSGLINTPTSPLHPRPHLATILTKLNALLPIKMHRQKRFEYTWKNTTLLLGDTRPTEPIRASYRGLQNSLQPSFS